MTGVASSGEVTGQPIAGCQREALDFPRPHGTVTVQALAHLGPVRPYGCAAAALPTGALLVARMNREAQVWLDGEVTQVLGVMPILDAVLADLTGSGLPQARPARPCQPHMHSCLHGPDQQHISHNGRAPHILRANLGAQHLTGLPYLHAPAREHRGVGFAGVVSQGMRVPFSACQGLPRAEFEPLAEQLPRPPVAPVPTVPSVTAHPGVLGVRRGHARQRAPARAARRPRGGGHARGRAHAAGHNRALVPAGRAGRRSGRAGGHLLRLRQPGHERCRCTFWVLGLLRHPNLAALIVSSFAFGSRKLQASGVRVLGTLVTTPPLCRLQANASVFACHAHADSHGCLCGAVQRFSCEAHECCRTAEACRSRAEFMSQSAAQHLLMLFAGCVLSDVTEAVGLDADAQTLAAGCLAQLLAVQACFCAGYSCLSIRISCNPFPVALVIGCRTLPQPSQPQMITHLPIRIKHRVFSLLLSQMWPVAMPR